ncbi:MAG TPA: MipA/OmpV family protein [Pseudoduganella sp.]
MHKFLVFAIAGACGTVAAQTPATNPMPDGSRDMYVGLGAQYQPRYDGARHNKTVALPVLQIQWSNGIFVSGLSAGMHLSSNPAIEYGPLLSIAPRRDEDGMGGGIGGVGDGSGGALITTILPPGGIVPGGAARKSANRLEGMDVIRTRLLYGGFFNYYFTPRLRLNNSVLYGAGNDRNGLRWRADLQYMMPELAAHHSMALSAGVSVVNRAYNNAYFGVSKLENERNSLGAYEANGGVQDAHLGARWNWSLGPSWMLTSNLQVSRLLGDAKASPLVERPTNVTVSTALAYRF